MAMKDLDLVSALGVPEAPKSDAAPKAGKSKGPGSNYLANKPPKLKAFLMDAVDPSLSHEERAEALCRALEEQSAPADADDAPPDSKPPLAPEPIGAGFEDY